MIASILLAFAAQTMVADVAPTIVVTRQRRLDITNAPGRVSPAPSG